MTASGPPRAVHPPRDRATPERTGILVIRVWLEQDAPGRLRGLPVDAAATPCMGSYVYNSGNLALDLLDNLMLESTGRLQKCRLYEMTANKTARTTISACTPSSPTSGWTGSRSWPRSSRGRRR